MPTAQDLLEEIKPLGATGYKNILLRHGIREPVYGVKVEYLKKIQKRIKRDYELANDLYDTGVYDAMYLAGLIADDAQMTKKDLQRWAKQATCSALAQTTVAWVAAQGKHGYDLALEWIDSPKELVAAAGWSTLSSLVALKNDDDLDLAKLGKLLARIEKTIHDAPNHVRSAMNNAVIAIGTYVKPLNAEALRVAKAIGVVNVDVGDTACQVPLATDYIKKAQQRGSLGKKRKTVKC